MVELMRKEERPRMERLTTVKATVDLLFSLRFIEK